VPRESRVTVKDYDGKKLYGFIQKKNGRPAGAMLSYDDRTSILTAGKDSTHAYLASRRGALPSWLSADVWEGFRKDDLVVAWDSSVLQQVWNVWERGWPAEQAAYLPTAPLFQGSKSILAGFRLGDPVRFHAVVAARDENSAKEVEKAAEAGRLQGLKAIQTERAACAKKNTKADLDAMREATVWEPILVAMRFRREGTVLHIESSVPTATFHDLIVSIFGEDEASGKSAASDDRHGKK
jgi:hypothetical protein